MEFALSQIGSLSNTSKAFVNQDPQLKAILGEANSFYNIDSAIQGKSQFSQSKREVLTQVLKSQYAFLDQSDTSQLVLKNINLLNSENTYTVSTGQQLHLFLGPAFVIYKILAVIQYCETLKKHHPDKNFVPIYWLASEDHDFQEIQKTPLFNHEFSWNTNQNGACGRFHLNEVDQLIEEIKLKINLNESQLELIHKFQNIYNSSKTLSEASIQLTHEVFGAMGLVCIDADQRDLKSLFKDCMLNDIIEQAHIQAFEASSQELNQNGYHLQLNAREINFFYLTQNSRKRIIQNGDQFQIADGNISFSKAEIIEEIEQYPERFSPNAVLRPLYQETILPNVAYIGGNAEVNYWIQISKLFDINNISRPKLLLRPSLWILPTKIKEWLEKQNISGVDLLISQNPEKHLNSLGAELISIKPLIESFISLKKQIQDSVNQINKSEFMELVDLGKAYEKAIKNAEKNSIEIEKTKVDNSLKKLDDIFRNYFDIKHLQERNCSSLEMLIKYANVAFLLKNKVQFTPETGLIISI